MNTRTNKQPKSVRTTAVPKVNSTKPAKPKNKPKKSQVASDVPQPDGSQQQSQQNVEDDASKTVRLNARSIK